MKIQARAIIKEGKMKVNRNDLSNFHKDLEGWEGKHVVVSVEKKKKTRSNQQNKFYWAVVVPIFRQGLRDIGEIMSIEQTHDLLKFRFLIDEIVNQQTGEIIQRTKSTTELSTTEFMDLIDEIQRWGAEFLGVTIPDPDEDYYQTA